MKKKIMLKGVCLGAALAGLVALSPSRAEDYNAGLLAAEAGDYAAAVSQWRPLADKGDAKAQFNLALLYHTGLGVGFDEAKAVAWYKRAADNGYGKAQEFLSAAYREGWFGLPRDARQADYWDRRLAQGAP
jgi:TPR repeat protein